MSFDFSTFESSIAVGIMVLAAWVGSLIGSYPLEKYGRKVTLLANSFLFLVGAVLSGSGKDTAFFIGRSLSGLAAGVVSVMNPVLLSEIADPNSKGVITTMHQVLLAFGIFFVALFGYVFIVFVDDGWQYVQGFPALPVLAVLALQDFIPESPKWLIMNGRRPEAEACLNYLRPEGYDVNAEIMDMVNEMKESADKDEPSWDEVFACRKAMIVGCGLMIFQSFTGINSVVFYSTTIFGFAGFNADILATASVGAVNFIFTSVAAMSVDGMGRKSLLLTGTYTMAAALLVLASVLNYGDDVPTFQGYMAVLSALIFVIGYAVGLGSVVWVLMSEMMPNRLRVKALSLFLSINWFCNLMIALFTLPMIDLFGGVVGLGYTDDDMALTKAEKKGVAVLYYIFFSITLLSLVFIHGVVPETKGKTVDEIEGREGGAAGEDVPLLKPVEEDSLMDYEHELEG
jgi:sugar porter (SP) family MFS transporter